MSAQLAPSSVEISTTPPSKPIAPAPSNMNRCENEITSGPGPAVSAGEIRLASETVPAWLPAQNPSSPAPRAFDHPASPDAGPTELPVSNVSVAELSGTSSVLRRSDSGTSTLG